MLEIEYEPPSRSDPCECCGGVTTSLTRFVRRDGDAFAVVYLRFADNHDERVVQAAVSVGEWWDGTGPEDRSAFALRLRSGAENYGVMVRDAEDSPWREVELLGRMLDRDEALAHPMIDEVFHITDHLFEGDAALKGYLDTAPAE